MNHPIISIIVPVYNGDKYIEKSIESLLNNDYDNIEILICDDSSVDRSWGKLQKFKNNPKIKLFKNNQNKGPGFTRNFLLGQAKGDFIAIQDADDFSTSDRFKIQADYLIKNKEIDVVGSEALLVDQKGKKWGELKVISHPTHWQWLTQRSMVHATVMFRRKIIGKYNYNEELRMGEDYFFLTSMYVDKINMANITKPLYSYTINEGRLRGRGLKKIRESLKTKFVICSLFGIGDRCLFVFANLATVLVVLFHKLSRKN